MPSRIVRTAREALLRAAGSEALYLLFAFCSASVFMMDPFAWHREALDLIGSLAVVPWGSALCLLRLERRARAGEAPARADLAILLALLAWIVLPFAVRFGVTFNTMYSWYNHMVVFFGVYAFVTEARDLDAMIDWTSALFAALSAALGAPALYCVLTARTLGLETGGIGFGPDAEGCLSFGLHYNITGMVALCCALLALVGFFRRRHLLARLAHLIPALMMMLAVVLTQSRTSRYAMLAALAAGLYGLLAARLPLRRAILRHAAALACAAVALVAGYLGANLLTDAALSHYAAQGGRLASSDMAPAGPSPFAAALAEADAGDAGEPLPEAIEARPAVDATFSERTLIWKNLFALWRESPKSFLIGNGMGRTGSRIVQGTTHEADGSVAVHNAYLQFIADYGLIGFALLCAFLLLLAPRALRVLFARDGAPGDRVFAMLAVSQLLTGLMESQPLGAMSASNLVLFFSLAVLYARGGALSRARLSSGRPLCYNKSNS